MALLSLVTPQKFKKYFNLDFKELSLMDGQSKLKFLENLPLVSRKVIQREILNLGLKRIVMYSIILNFNSNFNNYNKVNLYFSFFYSLAYFFSGLMNTVSDGPPMEVQQNRVSVPLRQPQKV